MRRGFTLIAFFMGILVSCFWFWVFQKNKEEHQDSYAVLINQIVKMNKMIVAEQTSSSFINHQSKVIEIAGYDFFPKEMMVYSEIKAQLTYDLAKMKYKVDANKKILVIEEIPSCEIKFYPNSKIHYMDDNLVNRFDKNSINQIIQKANANVILKIDQNLLRAEGRKQLMTNLNDIFILANALNYKIEDKTGENIQIDH